MCQKSKFVKLIKNQAAKIQIKTGILAKTAAKFRFLKLGTFCRLTVQKRVSVIVTLSGQNTLSALIYPKLVVYPRGVCTHNEGSFGPPWGLQGAPQKMTPFIVVKL